MRRFRIQFANAEGRTETGSGVDPGARAPRHGIRLTLQVADAGRQVWRCKVRLRQGTSVGGLVKGTIRYFCFSPRRRSRRVIPSRGRSVQKRGPARLFWTGQVFSEVRRAASPREKGLQLAWRKRHAKSGAHPRMSSIRRQKAAYSTACVPFGCTPAGGRRMACRTRESRL